MTENEWDRRHRATYTMKQVNGVDLVLTGSETKLFLKILVLYDRDGRVTIRTLTKEMGFRTTNAITLAMEGLVRKGFVSKTPYMAASIVPKYRVELFRKPA